MKGFLFVFVRGPGREVAVRLCEITLHEGFGHRTWRGTEGMDGHVDLLSLWNGWRMEVEVEVAIVSYVIILFVVHYGLVYSAGFS